MSQHRVLFVVSLAASLLMIGVGMIVALLPQRVLAFSGSLQQVGYIASAFALSYLLVQIPFGALADRLGAKPLLVQGYMLCAVSGLVFCFAGSQDAVFFGRFLQGAGEAPIWALGPALLALAYPQAKGRAIGIYNAAIHAGLAAGPLIGVALFPLGTGNAPFLWFAALCVCGGLTVLLALPRPAAAADRPHVPSLSSQRAVGLLKVPGVLATLSGVLLYGAGYGTFISVLPASLALTQAFDGLASGVFFTLFYLSISVAQLIVGPLSDRRGRRTYMVAGMTMAAVGFAAFGAFELPWVYGPLTLASAGLGIFCVSSLAFLTETAPAGLKSTLSGLYYLFWGLGYLLAPILIGWLGETLHAQAGFWLLAGLLAAQAGTLIVTGSAAPDGSLKRR